MLCFDELANSDGQYALIDHRDIDGFGDVDGVLVIVIVILMVMIVTTMMFMMNMMMINVILRLTVVR